MISWEIMWLFLPSEITKITLWLLSGPCGSQGVSYLGWLPVLGKGEMKNLGEKPLFISLGPQHSTENISLEFSYPFQDVEDSFGCFPNSAGEGLRGGLGSEAKEVPFSSWPSARTPVWCAYLLDTHGQYRWQLKFFTMVFKWSEMYFGFTFLWRMPILISLHIQIVLQPFSLSVVFSAGLFSIKPSTHY